MNFVRSLIAVLAALSATGQTNAKDFLKNEQVRIQLRQNSDDGFALRSIDHYAYFSTEAGRNSYHAFLVSRGYRVDRENTDSSYPDNPWEIIFSKIQSPQEIDNETALLSAKAKELRGDYDGWETDVVRKK